MNRNEPFAAFCNRVAAHVNVKIPHGDYILPEEYNEIAPKLLHKLKAIKDTFPAYSITFIQSALSDMDSVIKRVREKLIDDEVPNGLLTYYAHNLYTTFDEKGDPVPGTVFGYNDLPESLQNIIKVVSVYTILQS